MKDRHLVRRHKTREIAGNADSYENWTSSHPRHIQKGNLGDKFDFITEDVRANPDSLREDESIYASGQPTTPQFLLGEAVNHLQGRQREIYLLIMRDNKSFSEVAEILNISKGSVQVYSERAVKFIMAYCKAAIKAGRV